jgi:hypothetical protein
MWFPTDNRQFDRQIYFNSELDTLLLYAYKKTYQLVMYGDNTPLLSTARYLAINASVWQDAFSPHCVL